MQLHSKKIPSGKDRKISFMFYEKSKDEPWIIGFLGAGSDTLDWYTTGTELAKLSNFLIVDKPGFLSTTPNVEPISQYQIIDDVYTVCDYLGVRTGHLIGHSLGYISALAFANKFRKKVEIASITSLDGVSFNPLSIELINQLTPAKSMIQYVANWVFKLGLVNVSATEKDYPEDYLAQIPERHLNQVITLRNKRGHNQAIVAESQRVPIWVKKYGQQSAILQTLKYTPQHHLQAVQWNKPIEQEAEVIHFPHLKSLVEKEKLEKIAWCERVSQESKGIYKSIESEHFIQWYFPSEIAQFMRQVINRDG